VRRDAVSRAWGISCIAAVVLSGCGGLSTSNPAESPTWLAVRGPVDWIPPEPMSLEIDGSAWSITPEGGGGVVTPEVTTSAEVRLLAVEGCHLYASFEVAPGSAHVISFAADGSVAVVDVAGQAREMGPGLVERPPTGCQPSLSP
jgi:hypothetical protein